MSWAAHEFENYFLQKHAGLRASFLGIAVGTLTPDLFTKYFVYHSSDPAHFHRGWPGVGFTHSLIFGVAVCLVIWKVFGSKLWGVSFVIGHWAHALTDCGDTVGTMLLFPWTFHFHADAWAYAGQTGRMTDAAAYFSGLGGMWDAVWIVYGLFSWRVLTRSYFRDYIVRADAFWGWAGKRLPELVLLTFYRAAFFYGTARWIAWTIWAHGIHDYPYDLTWGGPHWIDAAHP